MSKYDALWKYVEAQDKDVLSLSFNEIEKLLTFPVDHSLLTFKKELLPLGFEVGKISMKEKTVKFLKRNDMH